MNYSIYDFIGNIGVILLLGTYFMLQLGKIKSESLMYSILNLAASSFIWISLLVNFNLSAFIVQFAWSLISILGIFRYFYIRKSKPA